MATEQEVDNTAAISFSRISNESSLGGDMSKLKLMFFINGSEASAAGIRAKMFAERLPSEWDIRFNYRPTSKWKGILPLRKLLAEPQPWQMPEKARQVAKDNFDYTMLAQQVENVCRELVSVKH